MITWMQKNRKFLVPTLWISAIAFIGSGAVGWGKYSYGNSGDSIAKVGNVEISSAELQSTTNSIFNYYNRLFGGKLTKEQAMSLNIQQQALQKLTDDALLLNYANDIGIIALDSEIIKEYTSIDAFKSDGKFSKSKYEQILRSQGINKKSFEKEIKKGVILKKLKKALSLPATRLEEESLFAGKSLKDHILIEKITKDPSSIEVSEDDIKSSWENSKNEYLTDTTYLLESIKTSVEDIKVSEDEIKDYYNQNKYKFKDEEGKIKKLSSATDEVKKALQFKKAKSQTLKKYLSLKKGKIKADNEILVDSSSSPVLLSELKGVKEGVFLKAVKLDNAYITAKVKSITPPKPKSYKEAKELVKLKLQQQKALQELENEAKKLSNTPLKNPIDLGFVNPSKVANIKELSPDVASNFLRTVFSKNKKNGYFIEGNEAIIYEIKEQKLFDLDAFNKERDVLAKNIDSLKRDLIDSGIIKVLRKKYKIEQLVKFTKKRG